MTIPEILGEVAGLPVLTVAETTGASTDTLVSPLTVLSKQGRLLLRLSAALDTLETRVGELRAQQEAERQERERLLRIADQWHTAERRLRQESEERFEKTVLEAIHFLDSLEWAADALAAKRHALAKEVALARKDGVQRLASLGVTEVPAVGPADGRLHEGVDTVSTNTVPPYHIVKVIRCGWQAGEKVLRRAAVLTAVPLTAGKNGAEADSATTEETNELDQRGKQREPASGKRRTRRDNGTFVESDRRD
ncbi:MAG: nucleotide exchange factor GrpE [Capsulimonadales bacterium]|nr:nucleotide exchange factor GrpE [Capsulimonadales bacterium]